MPKNNSEINETTPVQEILDIEEPVFETPNAKENNEPTEEEKKELYIQQLKDAQISFKSLIHNGKTTINKFGSTYKKVRKSKNRQQRQSRKANR